MSLSQQRQNAMGSSKGDGLHLKGKHECGRTQDKDYGGRQRKSLSLENVRK